MKIAVLGTRGFPDIPGGIEAHCENLYTYLARKGCDITVFTRRPYVRFFRSSYRGVKLVSLPCLKNKFLETILHTFIGVFTAKSISPDILHIHGIGPSLVTPMARILGLNVITTNHGPDYERKKWNKFAKFILVLGEYLSSKYSNNMICISDYIADTVRKKYKREPFIIPNGVNIKPISEIDDVIVRYGLVKYRYILSVGRFVPEKGFHDLIKAFNSIRDWKLVIAGDSDHPDKYSLGLKKEAAKNNSIILTGFLNTEALQQLYSYAGIFVLPSYYEGMPIALLEAMSYGLSCIASDIPPHRDIGLREDRFFKAGDVQGLASKIMEFMKRTLTDQEKKEQIGKIEKRYNWAIIANRTLEVYKQVK